MDSYAYNHRAVKFVYWWHVFSFAFDLIPFFSHSGRDKQ